LAFTLSAGDSRADQLQVEWREARLWEMAPSTRRAEYIDWRQHPHPQTLLAELPAAQVWAEGGRLESVPTVLRHQLQPAETLVIWTAPPGQDIFQQALLTTEPRQVVVVAQLGLYDTLPAFIKQLMGLIKYAVSRREGEVELGQLAAALGHRPQTVRWGIDWLVAQGRLTIEIEEDGLLVLRFNQQPSTEEAAMIEEILKTALVETAAYRQFFRQASLKALDKSSGPSLLNSPES
jgi:hypothetical protein